MGVFKSLLIFASGAVVGALVMRLYIHKQLENAEYEEPDGPIDDQPKEEKEPTFAEYAAELAKQRGNYIDYSAISNGKQEPKPEPVAPIVIDYDSFGQTDGYDVYSFDYYADGIVADETGEVMTEEEIKTTIGGRKVLELFNRPNTWTIYIRNDILKTEYEICLDKRKYAEVNPNKGSVSDDEDGD